MSYRGAFQMKYYDVLSVVKNCATRGEFYVNFCKYILGPVRGCLCTALPLFSTKVNKTTKLEVFISVLFMSLIKAYCMKKRFTRDCRIYFLVIKIIVY